jgi:hypothetical protein
VLVSWLIPVRLDDCEVPDLDIGAGRTLRSLDSADLFGERRSAELSRLVDAVTRILASRPDGLWGEEAMLNDVGLYRPIAHIAETLPQVADAATAAQTLGPDAEPDSDESLRTAHGPALSADVRDAYREVLCRELGGHLVPRWWTFRELDQLRLQVDRIGTPGRVRPGLPGCDQDLKSQSAHHACGSEPTQ